jgi:hypothetical protein
MRVIAILGLVLALLLPWPNPPGYADEMPANLQVPLVLTENGDAILLQPETQWTIERKTMVGPACIVYWLSSVAPTRHAIVLHYLDPVNRARVAYVALYDAEGDLTAWAGGARVCVGAAP